MIMKTKLIDLGLPSGTLWADCNIGADAPENAGYYFRFGETTPFTENSPEYVYDDINESIAGTDRDAATVILGEKYSMPTLEQIQELIYECKWDWIKQNDVNGMKVVGSNGNSIFLPASGYRNFGNCRLYYAGLEGYYWSASFSSNSGCNLDFNSGSWCWYYKSCPNGLPIRAVYNENR